MLTDLQNLLVHACGQPDPAAWLRAAAADPAAPLDTAERQMLAAIDPDGLRLTALLVRKLRFERLLRGDPAARAAFAQDPDSLLTAFRDYAIAVPPTAVFPEEEAAAFRARP